MIKSTWNTLKPYILFEGGNFKICNIFITKENIYKTYFIPVL